MFSNEVISKVKRIMKGISVIDSHTAGEPTRINVDGFGKVKGSTMAERMSYLKTNMDWLRKSLMCEPCGHASLGICAMLVETTRPCCKYCSADNCSFGNPGGYSRRNS